MTRVFENLCNNKNKFPLEAAHVNLAISSFKWHSSLQEATFLAACYHFVVIKPFVADIRWNNEK